MIPDSLSIPWGNNEDIRSTSIQFHATDSETLFEQNFKTLRDTNWRWLNQSIEYTFNDKGFRCNFEFDDDFDFSNYIVVLGCSHVTGVGSPMEETVTEQLSNITKYPVINMGVPGASNSLIFQNLVWILSRKYKPKKIVVIWTSLYRDTIYTQKMKRIQINASRKDNYSLERKEFSNYMSSEYITDYLERVSLSHYEMVSHMSNIDVYAFDFFNTSSYLDLANKNLEPIFLNKFSLGREEFDLHWQERQSTETKAFSGEIKLDTFLDSWFGRDLTNLDPNLKLVDNLFAHFGPITNNWIANFITSKVM